MSLSVSTCLCLSLSVCLPCSWFALSEYPITSNSFSQSLFSSPPTKLDLSLFFYNQARPKPLIFNHPPLGSPVPGVVHARRVYLQDGCVARAPLLYRRCCRSRHRRCEPTRYYCHLCQGARAGLHLRLFHAQSVHVKKRGWRRVIVVE
jgi:hypothetical protein